MSGLSMEICMSNLKVLALTVLELLAQKFRGSCDPGNAPFSKKILEVMSELSLETCMSNLKSVALTVLKWSN